MQRIKAGNLGAAKRKMLKLSSRKDLHKIGASQSDLQRSAMDPEQDKHRLLSFRRLKQERPGYLGVKRTCRTGSLAAASSLSLDIHGAEGYVVEAYAALPQSDAGHDVWR